MFFCSRLSEVLVTLFFRIFHGHFWRFTDTFSKIVTAKVPYFFISAEKLGDSLDLGNFCFFFFPILEKKRKQSFFFSQEKFASHSLTRETVDLQKKVKTGKKWHFLSNFGFFRCFFFPKKFPKILFFFPRKRLHVTHSLEFQGRKKKKQPRKKKTAFLLNNSNFSKKCAKTNFYGEIKKYGTFAWPRRKNMGSLETYSGCFRLTHAFVDNS